MHAVQSQWHRCLKTHTRDICCQTHVSRQGCGCSMLTGLSLCAADSLPGRHHMYPLFHSPGYWRRGHLSPASAALPGLEQLVRALLSVSQGSADQALCSQELVLVSTSCGGTVEWALVGIIKGNTRDKSNIVLLGCHNLPFCRFKVLLAFACCCPACRLPLDAVQPRQQSLSVTHTFGLELSTRDTSPHSMVSVRLLGPFTARHEPCLLSGHSHAGSYVDCGRGPISQSAMPCAAESGSQCTCAGASSLQTVSFSRQAAACCSMRFTQW